LLKINSRGLNNLIQSTIGMFDQDLMVRIVKALPQTLAMISEDFIAGIAHEALYPR
jgi:hypothetical protein